SLADRKIELAFSRIHNPVADDQFSTETMFHDSYVVVAGKRSQWARRRKVQLAELVNERWTLLPSDAPAGTLVAWAFRSHGLEPPRGTVSTLSINVHNRLLATGRFLALQPGYLFRLPGKHPSLTTLPVKLPATRRPVAIFTLKGKTLSPLAQLFLDR